MITHSFTEEGRFSYVQTLGNGSTSSVVLAKSLETGELFAIKQIDREFVNSYYVCSEVLNHSSLNHPHVVAFKEVFLSPRKVNIVMDYVSGGCLLDYVRKRRRLKEPVARWFFQQLVLAVDYCHRQGVVNRDIKLDNLLLQPVPGAARPLLKVCDFGYSKSGPHRLEFSKVGTFNYMAPEVLHNHCEGYDARTADVWSCGVVLYAMLTGRYPFPGAAGGAEREGAAAGPPRAPEDPEVGAACGALLRRLLHPDPDKRIKVKEIIQDPWFQTDLPPAALSMNERFLSAGRSCKQSQDEIRAVVECIRTDTSSSALSTQSSLERVSL